MDHPAPYTIIIISGDRGFAYAVSLLRLRRYRVVVITPPDTHISLKSRAAVCIDWDIDIMDRKSDDHVRSPLLPNGNGASHEDPYTPARTRSEFDEKVLSSAGTKYTHRGFDSHANGAFIDVRDSYARARNSPDVITRFTRENHMGGRVPVGEPPSSTPPSGGPPPVSKANPIVTDLYSEEQPPTPRSFDQTPYIAPLDSSVIAPHSPANTTITIPIPESTVPVSPAMESPRSPPVVADPPEASLPSFVSQKEAPIELPITIQQPSVSQSTMPMMDIDNDQHNELASVVLAPPSLATLPEMAAPMLTPMIVDPLPPVTKPSNSSTPVFAQREGDQVSESLPSNVACRVPPKFKALVKTLERCRIRGALRLDRNTTLRSELPKTGKGQGEIGDLTTYISSAQSAGIVDVYDPADGRVLVSLRPQWYGAKF